MTSAAARRFAALPTAAKLLLILTAALLPIGIALVWFAESEIRDANDAVRGRTVDQARSVARSVESLIARNVLAMRIAANGALATGTGGACSRAQHALAVAPAVAQRFEMENTDGAPLCTVGDVDPTSDLPLVAPGDIFLRVRPGRESLIMRVGVVGGMATAALPVEEMRRAIGDRLDRIDSLSISDGVRTLDIDPAERRSAESGSAVLDRLAIANGQLTVDVGATVLPITLLDRLLLLLPLLMWLLAALISWVLVTRLLIRPLRRLERAVSRLQPGEGVDVLPGKLGPATEIQQLRDAFARGLTRVEDSEQEMGVALEGQRRLVREVHHRVKNNLQVVASLLNIHGRTAETADARAAYAAIGRRVGALSIVHRNHFAEMEENRGIALRPLIAELAAELRAGAPDEARGLAIDLDIEAAYTTQDAAMSVAFLITEIIEFAMLNRPNDPVEVELRRSSDLTAQLTLSSPVLVPDEAEKADKLQFERIIAGLAKQLRSDLDRKLGRYGVDLPVFPAP